MESCNKNLKDESERRKLLGIFPHEIWVYIFEAVEEPDLLTVWSNASSFWREILEPKRTQFMFPQVLNILGEQKFFTQQDCHYLLQQRLVCKCWKLGVNNFAETRSNHKNLQFWYYQHHAASDIFQPIHFRLYRNKIISKLETDIIPNITSRNDNPFPSRHIEIQEQDLLDEDFDEGLAKVVIRRARFTADTFLEKGGHHFWYAHIDAGLFLRTPEWYNLLNKYAALMPNLKSVYIRYPSHSWCQSSQLSDVTPFPILSDLEVLSIGNAPKSVMNTIFQGCRGLEVLIIPRLCVPAEFEAPIYEAHQESLDFSPIKNPETLSIDFQNLQDFSNLPDEWNLRVFRLRFTSQRVHWKDIFEKLESFKTSLKELYLQLPAAISPNDRLINWESSLRKLDLPYLKSLHIQIVNNCSLDFLLGLTSLEHLNMHFKYCEISPPSGGNNENDQQMNFNFNSGFPDRFMDCNIWTLMPTLNIVELKITSGREFKYRRGCVVQLKNNFYVCRQ